MRTSLRSGSLENAECDDKEIKRLLNVKMRTVKNMKMFQISAEPNSRTIVEKLLGKVPKDFLCFSEVGHSYNKTSKNFPRSSHFLCIRIQ